ncbi:protein artichoke [Copidosoma floridanum]|uniref:protein artichoke n=1 Tax=Copidosoma floridanum TaxID=29053 RepID=UPI000C6FBD0C|nr:protein artichoke [Copidosoma floridanum]
MGKPPEGGGSFARALLLVSGWAVLCAGQEYGCPPQEKILPCRCSTRDMEFQIWCSHSELPRVLEGLQAVSRHVTHPVDELILENNNLLSLPGHVFASLRVLRLMLRNNRLERVSSGWLEGLHDSLLELFLVEPELRSLPVDSLENLQGLEAVTLQSKLIKRLPSFSGLPKLRYLQLNSPSLLELSPRNFRELASLEQLHVFGSPKLSRLEAGLLRDLSRLQLINVTDCGINWLHPRALINLPELKELSLAGNAITDATMVGRALVDLPAVSVLHLDRNRIPRLEASFADLPNLSRISLSFNRITEIFPGTFQRVPQLRTLNLNHNRIHRIHPEFFPQRGREANNLEEIWLMDNDIGHVSEIRAVLEALPRLKFLEASFNQIQEVQYGALHGHSSLERLHLDYNRLAFVHFSGMPALRELRLRNNSLTNAPDTPFWDLPGLKGLDISGNFFRHVEPRLLANLPSLRRLDLSENAIALVEPDAFLGTPALEHVNLSANALSVLHPMTFRHLVHLYELDVGWNRLLEIIPGLPRNIEHLHLPMNRIIALPVSLSSGSLALPLLRTLDLSANGIEHLPIGALSGLPSLRKLNLGFNALAAIEEGSFDGLGRLEQLDLKYNRIGQLHGRCFRPLRSLLELSLRGNRLELIRSDVFQDNPALARLDLSRNNLAQLPQAAFASTRELRELYASHNALQELPSSLHGLGALEILDLSHNKLAVLAPETLSSLASLVELRLARNRVRELREGAFDRLPRLALVDLESNDLALVEARSVRDLPELQAIKLGKNRIQTIPSGAFSELPVLQSAELQENRIQDIAAGAFVNVPHLLFLNLSHNQLTGLDSMGLDSLRSLEVLDLSDNRISRVSGDSLAAMEWLVELKMDNNRICAVQGSPFDDMPRLRVLSLRNNRMASVTETAFKRLRSNIAVLDIDGNPLSCSCGMLWLRGWIQQASTDGPRCADGSLFRDVRLSRQDCQRERQLEPVQPGCEPECVPFLHSSSACPHTVQNTEPASPWSVDKSPARHPPGVEDATDYDAYEDYEEYPSVVNSSDLTANSLQGGSEQSVPVVTLAPQASAKNTSLANNKRNPQIPPSPSSSGFTFFGVPLPSLSFSLWGNAGKKERKDDSSGSGVTASSRPGRSRYRNFPPTEPEIHRGGFVPLPRGQGGFVPIADPRLEERRPGGNGTAGTFGEGVGQVVLERKSTKTTNYTVGKIERTSGALPRNHSSANKYTKLRHPVIRDSEEPSAENSGKPAFIPTQRLTNREPIIVHPYEGSVEADETLISTEVYRDEMIEFSEGGVGSSSEMAGRIMWTTPRNSTSAGNGTIIGAEGATGSTMLRETVTASVSVFPPKKRTGPRGSTAGTSRPRVSTSTLSSSSDYEMPTETASKLEVPARENSKGTRGTMLKSAPVTYNPDLASSTGHTRSSEAAVFLVPGGQLPTVSVSSMNNRPVGRPIITKVSSPRVELTSESNFLGPTAPAGSTDRVPGEKPEKLLAKEDNHLSGSTLDERVKPADDSAFDWYYRQYNDTNLEPYVGIVYEDTRSSTSRAIVLAVAGSPVPIWLLTVYCLAARVFA